MIQKWLITVDIYIYCNKIMTKYDLKLSLKELENKQIEKSDLDAIAEDVNLVKNFFKKTIQETK